MGESVEISVVLPVFNEKGHLVAEVDRIARGLKEAKREFEIIVVDDGSTDGSGALAQTLANVRVLRFAQNRGSGSARKYGTLAAKGEVVVWTDADMTYPNDEISELVEQLEGFDQVVGARTSEKGTIKILRLPAKWIIRKLASYLTGVKIPDLNSGFRAMRRDVALQFLYLLPVGFSCVTTMTLSFLTNGYSIKYIPITYGAREGKSKFHWWRDTRRYVVQVVRMILLYDPLRVLGPPTVLLSLTAVGKLLFDILDKDFRVGTNTLVLIGSAVAMGVVGMISDLLVQSNKRRLDVIPATLSAGLCIEGVDSDGEDLADNS